MDGQCIYETCSSLSHQALVIDALQQRLRELILLLAGAQIQVTHIFVQSFGHRVTSAQACCLQLDQLTGRRLSPDLEQFM